MLCEPCAGKHGDSEDVIGDATTRPYAFFHLGRPCLPLEVHSFNLAFQVR
jgi:hypothetical protein